MHRRNVLTAVSAIALGSCARLEKRRDRYDQTDCPFCVPKEGECSYCGSSGKCSYCDGKGVRTTTTKQMAQGSIKNVEYKEDCPFCKATGQCRYCAGVGKCFACKGTGTIDNWDFQEKAKQKSALKKEK